MKRPKLPLSRETLTRLNAEELTPARGGSSTNEPARRLISFTCDPPPPDYTGLP